MSSAARRARPVTRAAVRISSAPLLRRSREKSGTYVQSPANKIRGRNFRCNPLIVLARPAGLEPTTPWFVARCSNPTELRARSANYIRRRLTDVLPGHGDAAHARCNASHTAVMRRRFSQPLISTGAMARQTMSFCRTQKNEGPVPAPLSPAERDEFEPSNTGIGPHAPLAGFSQPPARSRAPAESAPASAQSCAG